MDDQHADKPDVPSGVECVLAMAAADEEFAQALVARRVDALAASGVVLAPTDRALLTSVSPEALAQLVSKLDSAVLFAHRRDVLIRMAAAAMIALGGGIAAGLAGCTRKPAEDKQDNPLASGPSPRPKPEMQPAGRVDKRPVNPFDFKQKPLANPTNDSPCRKDFGDGMGPSMRPTPPMGRPLDTTSWSDWFTPGAPQSTALTGSRPDRPMPTPRIVPVPRVTMGGNQVVGPMEQSMARRVLRRRFSAIRRCYSSVTTHPLPKGTLRVALIVGANGKVTYVRLAGSLGHKVLRSCVDKVLRRTTFPRYAKASTITVSFHFKVE